MTNGCRLYVGLLRAVLTLDSQSESNKRPSKKWTRRSENMFYDTERLLVVLLLHQGLIAFYSWDISLCSEVQL